MKKVIIIAATLVLVAIVVVTGVIMHQCYVDIGDDERIMEFAKKYVKETDIQLGDNDEVQKDNEVEIVSTSDIVKEEEMGIISVLVKYKSDGMEKIDCVYFTRNKIFKNLYEVKGGLGVEKGEITACSQNVNDINIAFIVGMDISDAVTEYFVEELEYTGKIEDGWCLEMMQTENLTHFEVETK